MVRRCLSPVGRAQHHTDTTSSVLGASASTSWVGAPTNRAPALRCSFALPRPDALSPRARVRALPTKETNVSTWERPFVVDRNICNFCVVWCG